MRTQWRQEWPFLAILSAIVVGTALVWSRVPERVPVHWDIQGQVDRYGSKAEGLLLGPAIAIGIYLLLLVIPRIDPKRANYANFAHPYWLARLAMLIFFAALQLLLVLTMLGHLKSTTGGINVLIGLLFVFLGSIMGKFRQSWFVGFRTPWTISSSRAWNKTNRLGGWLFVVVGCVLIVAGWLDSLLLMGLAFGGMLLGVSCLTVYSYFLWRDDPGRTPAAQA